MSDSAGEAWCFGAQVKFGKRNLRVEVTSPAGEEPPTPAELLECAKAVEGMARAVESRDGTALNH